MDEKKTKIETLEKKLGQIRKQALFLGDMSEMHCKAIKQRKQEVDEEERDKSFLAEQVLKTRKETVKIKRKL
jgi:CRISPR/Cas system-associated endoribonuclease Cas2